MKKNLEFIMVAALITLLAIIIFPAIGVKHALEAPQPSVQLEIANDPMTRSKGLSARSSLGAGQGMLFIYDKPAIQCMWMKDVAFDLDVAFLDASNKVINVERMAAKTIEPHCSTSPALRAIEMLPGSFDK